MPRARVYIIIGVCLLFPIYAGAIDLPCDNTTHPQVCAFLNRYISELLRWNEPNVSVYQKMRDDKFVILNGSLESIKQCTDTTAFSLKRYNNKAYEIVWNNGDDTLMHVAFPIQYELILGMPQIEIEQHLQEYIIAAPNRQEQLTADFQLDSVAPGIYRSAPRQHYQIPALNNSRYFVTSQSGGTQLICDTAYLDYTIANLFQDGLNSTCLMQVSQSIYGFKHLDYTISLQQWLNYCAAERMISYVAIESVTEETVQVLVVAENTDLAYNHLLSVLVPRNILEGQTGTLLVRLNAFIPTHNITDLYEQYSSKPKKQRVWTNE